MYPRCRGSAVGVLVGGRRPCLVELLHLGEVEAKHGTDLLLLEAQVPRRGSVEEEEDLMKLPVAAARYLLLHPAGSEGDEPLRRYPQAELLFDLPQTLQRLLPRREVPGGGNVEIVRPGIFRGGAPLEEHVRPCGIGTADPTVKTAVPKPKPVRLALQNDLPRGRPDSSTMSSSSSTRIRVAFQRVSTLRPPLVSTSAHRLAGGLSASQLSP